MVPLPWRLGARPYHQRSPIVSVAPKKGRRDAWHQTYRALEHGSARKACKDCLGVLCRASAHSMIQPDCLGSPAQRWPRWAGRLTKRKAAKWVR